MQRDCRGLPLSTDSAEAAALFDRAVDAYLKYHADTGRLAATAAAADPGFALGHVLRAYLLLLAAHPAQRADIAAASAAARAAARGLTPRERGHLDALDAWEAGALDRAFAAWRAILDAHPTDLLALRVNDVILFRHGQTASIREQADRVAPAWHPDLPGYENFLCVWAFAHEETGEIDPPLDAARAALARDPRNHFAHHVTAHVLEAAGRPREGAAWIAAQAPNYAGGNNVIHHLWWHRALMLLDLGERDAVLASYDEDVRNLDAPLTRGQPDHYVDLQNATALLWRLEQAGVDVGTRWEELAAKAEARGGDTTHPLLLPHLMLALAATGRVAAAERLAAAMRDAGAARTWTARGIAEAALPASEAVLAHRRGDHAAVIRLLAPRRAALRLLGGRAAQRAMFTQMLLDSARRENDRALAADLLVEAARAHGAPPAARAGYAEAADWAAANRSG
ncbi:MAG: hypothetical protein KGI51_10920 [Rhodospirillales bacterium]|nr:hypothetical protein [Rhodospirillales bacterium]